MDGDDLYAFLQDRKLAELIELNKTSLDLFEVIKLTENQQSDILAWCMNPNEGHLQGDAVIKEFLMAAYMAHMESSVAIGDNKKFFRKWTPGKINITSFGSAFVTRELVVPVDAAGKGRLDLFLVDHQNRILVTIENKDGAKLTPNQLEIYMNAVKHEALLKKEVKSYDKAFVVIDRGRESYSDDDIQLFGKYWALLGYRWLESSANRAQLQLSRGNKSAQLLVSYCQRQTNWQSPEEERMSELARELVWDHPDVIKEMHKFSKTHTLHRVLNSIEGFDGELSLFCAQHHDVSRQLLRIQGVAAIIHQIVKISNVKREQIDTGRSGFGIIPTAALEFWKGENEYWPMYVDIYRGSNHLNSDSQIFSVRFIWRRYHFNSSNCDELKLRNIFSGEFPGLEKFEHSDLRCLTVHPKLDAKEVVDCTVKLLKRIDSLIQRSLVSF